MVLQLKLENITNGDEISLTNYESFIQRSPAEFMVVSVLHSLNDPPPI